MSPTWKDVIFISAGFALILGVPKIATVVGIAMVAWGVVGLFCVWLDGKS